jgi:hypothetical protein
MEILHTQRHVGIVSMSAPICRRSVVGPFEPDDTTVSRHRHTLLYVFGRAYPCSSCFHCYIGDKQYSMATFKYDVVTLIELVKSKPALWDKTNDNKNKILSLFCIRLRLLRLKYNR